MGGPALQLEGSFAPLPKMLGAVYSWRWSRLTAGMKTAMHTVNRDPPQNDLGVGAAAKPHGPFEHSSFKCS